MSRHFAVISQLYSSLLLGIFSFFSAVAFTYTGKSWGGLKGWVYRAEEPKRFREVVATYYFGGVLLIGFFLYFALK